MRTEGRREIVSARVREVERERHFPLFRFPLHDLAP